MVLMTHPPKSNDSLSLRQLPAGDIYLPYSLGFLSNPQSFRQLQGFQTQLGWWFKVNQESLSNNRFLLLVINTIKQLSNLHRDQVYYSRWFTFLISNSSTIITLDLMLPRALRYLFGVRKVLKGPPVRKPSTRILTYNVKEFEPPVDVPVQKQKLSPHQLFLLETKSMQRPYTGHLWSQMQPGDYRCYVCNNKIFTSYQKFFPANGMASFWTHIPGRVTILDQEAIFEKNPNYSRFEATQVVDSPHKRCQCAVCKSHLGAVYFDGPAPTNLRFSINSVCLVFEHLKDFPDPNIIRKKKRQEEQKVKYEPITKW